VESSGFDLLAMGHTEGPGCYCYANNLLREVLKKLVSGYGFVVIDNEAGMEHVSRRTAREMDLLFLVSDCTAVGVRSADRIARVARDLDIRVGQMLLVVNRARDGMGKLEDEVKSAGIPLGAVVPYDGDLERLSVEGRPVADLEEGSPVRKSARDLFEKALLLS